MSYIDDDDIKMVQRNTHLVAALVQNVPLNIVLNLLDKLTQTPVPYNMG